jgi:hypothetical protein
MLRILTGDSKDALQIADRLEGHGARRAKSTNIPHGWLAEETVVFAIELAGTFISDFKSCTGGVEAVYEHARSRCLQPNLPLIH